MGARYGLYGGCSNGVPPIHFLQAKHRIQFISPHAISGLFQPQKVNSEARDFEVTDSLQHVFEKWVEEHCMKCITCQGRYSVKETVSAPPPGSDSE
jgi:hypothetical protein